MKPMDNCKLYVILLLCQVIIGLCELQTIYSPFKENEKVELRKELDQITQEMLIWNDSNHQLYHSYVFNSGVGNREELQVESLRKVTHFNAGKGVITWQSVQTSGLVYLLGRKLNSVSLIITSSQLFFNNSASFYEHSLGLGENISSTTLFKSWNHLTSQEEVIAVVAVDNLNADILLYRVINNKLVYIATWPHYRRTSYISAITVDGKTQLIVVETGSPAAVVIFDVIYPSQNGHLDFRIMQRLHLESNCSSVSVSHVGRQLYVMFVLPYQHSVEVYKVLTTANTNLFVKHKSLILKKVSQVVTFSLAHQMYLAANGETAYVFKITNTGDFIPEQISELISPGHVSEWLVVPVYSYRDDVVLFSKSGDLIKMFVWAGADKGFKSVPIPECNGSSGSCFGGEWLGSVSITFFNLACLLLPRSSDTSNLITLVFSLHDKRNPVLNKLESMIGLIKHHEGTWQIIKSQLLDNEESLKYVIKIANKNIITAKWKVNKLVTHKLHMNSIQPKSEVNCSSELSQEIGDIETLKSFVKETVDRAGNLIRAVKQKEKDVWGLENFMGKVTFKEALMVDNLNISSLNKYSVDHVLRNTFRTDKSKTIQGSVVVESLQVENLIVNEVNNLTFNDKQMIFQGNLTFLSPVTVDGDVKLGVGGQVNGKDLSEEFCEGREHCSVLPVMDGEARSEDFGTINNNSILETKAWSTVLSGTNLTVLNVNGVDWDTLTKNVIYRDRHQCVPGTLVVKGKMSSVKPIWTTNVQYYRYEQSDPEEQSSYLKMAQPGMEQLPVKIKVNTLPFDSTSDVIFSKLEVAGTVTCKDSMWGVSAADIVFRDAKPIKLTADKEFRNSVNVANNLEVNGSMTNLLTTDTYQVFNDSITLQGNITLTNITLAGLWNNLSGLGESNGPFPTNEVIANSVVVLETLNDIPIPQLLFTDDGITTVKNLTAENLEVTEDITVDRKVCNSLLSDFDEKRLSRLKDQTITGQCFINESIVKNAFSIKILNNVEVSSISKGLKKLENSDDDIHISALYVKGSITTDLGMNGHNLSDLTSSAVWLHSNNEISGNFNFKDEVIFNSLECQGFFNQKPCDDGFYVGDVVRKMNKTISLSGKKTFLNPLNISDDIIVDDINNHKMKEILTRTTEQNITGDIYVTGNVTVDEDTTLIGLLNNQNLTEIANKCKLSGSTITCKGNAIFTGIIDLMQFNSSGKINNINFDHFQESLVDTNTSGDLYINGFKTFTGEAKIMNIEVNKVNDYSWDHFLLTAVTQNIHEEVQFPVEFIQKVIANDISINFNIDADSINNVDLNEWQMNAIYLNDNFNLKRPLHLRKASNLGNLTVDTYGNVDMNVDIVKLHGASSMSSLMFKSITVTNTIEIANTVNGQFLRPLEEATLKISGDQMVTSDFVLMGNVLVDGNVYTIGKVNQQNLQDVVTLAGNQMLNGNYKFECIEALQNITSSKLISGLNITEWREAALLASKNQEVMGMWSVKGDVKVKGLVRGRGKLANIELSELKENITQNILNVHENMKANLSSTCSETNRCLKKARNQISELLYVDVSQDISVPGQVSQVTHFKSENENYLAVCGKGCITTIYNWNKHSKSFLKVSEEIMGYSVNKLLVLYKEVLTYLITESSDLISLCNVTGKHLWLFRKNQIKYITSLQFIVADELHINNNTLHSLNSTGVFKWDLELSEDGTAFFKSVYKWPIDSAGKSFVPQATGLGLALQDSTEITVLESALEWVPELFNNCTGELYSFSVDSTQQFIAVATKEKTRVPRYTNDIKVYQRSGRLFDKWQAKQASHLQWLSVPGQVWLVYLQNHSSIQFYHLQGILNGFQLKLQAKMEASDFFVLTLPSASKVNMQPYLIVQTTSSLTVLQTVLQGDTYLGPDLACSFDNALFTVPDNVQ